ncbi:hypothetical protein RFI_16957 [Reticulomyxa filosa]|uniref:Uncharacterized protein n=1 Tax=Reticulomyxa filosa TaxID=46433 RepID=X6N3C8_RETFI|nr:hypothetical protein RFI_16957 [Reticulomyxa filosa]|eukprot:ETO20259.1 hypothetical protein RFI_16957 [Reticulomyxa filosa]
MKQFNFEKTKQTCKIEIEVVVEIANLTKEDVSTVDYNHLFLTALDESSEWSSYDEEFEEHVSITLIEEQRYVDEGQEWLVVDYAVQIVEHDLVSKFKHIVTDSSFQSKFNIALKEQLELEHVSHSEESQVYSVHVITEHTDKKKETEVESFVTLLFIHFYFFFFFCFLADRVYFCDTKKKKKKKKRYWYNHRHSDWYFDTYGYCCRIVQSNW